MGDRVYGAGYLGSEIPERAIECNKLGSVACSSATHEASLPSRIKQGSSACRTRKMPHCRRAMRLLGERLRGDEAEANHVGLEGHIARVIGCSAIEFPFDRYGTTSVRPCDPIERAPTPFITQATRRTSAISSCVSETSRSTANEARLPDLQASRKSHLTPPLVLIPADLSALEA